MTTATKEPVKTTKVLLKDTKPLEKYLLPNGTMIEVCASSKVLAETGKLALMRRANGNIHAYLLDKNGDRRTAGGLDLHAEGGLNPDLEVEPVLRRGPKRRNDGLRWRGWGRKNAAKMDALVRIVGEEGFYVNWPESRKNHYANLGFESKKPCALFFSGELGFAQRPEGVLGSYPLSLKAGYGYMPHRVMLSQIVQWSEFETAFRRQLKEWKRSFIANARSAP